MEAYTEKNPFLFMLLWSCCFMIAIVTLTKTIIFKEDAINLKKSGEGT